MIFNVFPSEIGEHYSLEPEIASRSMKLHSYTSNKVATEDLKTEMSLRKVLISANTALGLHLTGRLKIWLTAQATGRPFSLHAWRLMSPLCLPNVTTSLPSQTQVNSGESDKGLKFQLDPMAGTHF